MNLELIINNNAWNIIILIDKKEYYIVDPTNRKLYIANMDVDSIKKAVWQNYHEPYRENYI